VRPTSTLDAPTLDRLRLLEQEKRLRPVRRIAEGLLVAGIIAVGLAGDAPEAAAAAVVLILLGSGLESQAQRSAVPGGWLAVQELGLLAAICVVIGDTGGLASPGLVLLAPAGALAGARRQGGPLAVALLAGFAAAVAACVLSDGPGFGDAAGAAPALGVAIVGVALLTSHLAHADRGLRADAVLDPLTGLLNRGALDARFVELRGQAELDELPLAIVLSDLDGLGQINADYGLARGDDVLAGAAEAMRRSLRTFELLYRLGGDEFLLVLPGASTTEATHLAERLRDAVATARPEGHAITASFGVAGGSGAGLPFGALLAEADVALYAAKSAGGDAVRTSGETARDDGPVAQRA
jgi:diguanylate cyclase (GGDEF)-like protein